MDSTPPKMPKDAMPEVIKTFICGVSMGAANIVPGVSGGTVALILGVYERLLQSISHFDAFLLVSLKNRQWTQAAKHVDLRFVASLGAGILVGTFGLASVMVYLLTQHRSTTFAAFFGLILASGLLVGRMMRPRGAGQTFVCIVWGLGAAAGAYLLLSMGRIQAPPGQSYIFVCGMVSICAMILPGVSGAYLLLMLGKYEEVTGIIKGIMRLETTSDEFLTVVVFSAGCFLGLLAFSRLLRWLLRRYWSATMAVLCGFMLGSLYRIWPLQVDTTPEVEEFKRKVFEPYWPTAWTAEVTACLVVATVSLLAVLLIDQLGRRYKRSSGGGDQPSSNA